MDSINHSSPQHKLLDICLRVFCDSENLARLPNDESGSKVALRSCGNPIIRLLLHLSNTIKNREGDFDLVIQRLDDLIALATEKFYAFPFKDVPPCWRDLFREASLLKFSALTFRGAWMNQNGDSGSPLSFTISGKQMDEMVKTIDMALIMAGAPPSSDSQEQIKSVFDLLQEIHMESIQASEEDPPRKRRKLGDEPGMWQDIFPMSESFKPPISHPISSLHEPSFDEFEKYMLHPRNHDLGPEPAIIAGALHHWPARNNRPWKSPSYLLSKTIGGRRLVPIELGRSYVDEGWGQKIITFKEFMEHYILDLKSALATGYLAQHDLFAQVSSLREDIAIPDYCFTSPPLPHHSSPLAEKHSKIPQLDEPLLNAWFGPAGTISPLHTDPYHNILSQVVGRKYVRLYAPRESEKLYARGVEDGVVDMGNTSSLDIGVLAGWDGTAEDMAEAHKNFPLFQEAEFVDCILEEGECLYIPVGWWHYVRSLSISFSVSFWFN